MKVYGISNCASVRKAKSFFENYGINYDFIDLNKSPVSKEKINQWREFCGPQNLFNPRSKRYRELNLKDKKLSDEKMIELLAKENALLRRPIIEHGLNGERKFTIGFDEKEYNETFL